MQVRRLQRVSSVVPIADRYTKAWMWDNFINWFNRLQQQRQINYNLTGSDCDSCLCSLTAQHSTATSQIDPKKIPQNSITLDDNHWEIPRSCLTFWLKFFQTSKKFLFHTNNFFDFFNFYFLNFLNNKFLIFYKQNCTTLKINFSLKKYFLISTHFGS